MLRHIGVDRLVVGQAGAKGIGHRHVAGAIGIEEPRAAQRRIGAKDQRIAEVVVHAAIDHVHALQPVGRAHVDDVVVRHQVAALDQIDAHLPREIGVLEVGGVEDSRRQQHDIRLRPALRRQRAQRGQQQLRIMLDGPHAVALKELRKGPLHHAAVGEHVAHAGGHAQIVFEHHKLAVVQPQQIRAHHRDVDVARHLQAAHLAPVVLAAVDQFARHHAVVQDLGVEVDIAQEKIERRDALRQAALDAVPLLGRNQPRQQVVGKDALGALVAPVDGEGDALGEERELGRLLAPLQLVLRAAAPASRPARGSAGALPRRARASRRRRGRADSLRRAFPLPLDGRRSWELGFLGGRFRAPAMKD